MMELDPIPGIKDEESWDVRGHKARLIVVDEDSLQTFGLLYDPPGTHPHSVRLPAVHTRQVLSGLRRFAVARKRLADLDDEYFCSEHFHETNQQKDGTIKRSTTFAKTAERWVVSGPHFYVGTPSTRHQTKAAVTTRTIPQST